MTKESNLIIEENFNDVMVKLKEIIYIIENGNRIQARINFEELSKIYHTEIVNSNNKELFFLYFSLSDFLIYKMNKIVSVEELIDSYNLILYNKLKQNES